MSLSDGATLFGVAGIVANLTWPLMRQRRQLLAWQVVACVLMLIHFELLSAHTGALVMLVAGLQAALASPLRTSNRIKHIYLGSLLLTPIVGYVTWQGPQSLFSSLALGIVCIANFQLNQMTQRAMLILAIFAWMAHNVLVQSVPALISNVLALGISTYMLFKVYSASR